MFANDAYPSKTFIVNPFGANSTLTSTLTTDGLLWHMLGQPSDDADAYAAFFPRVEAYVRTLQNIPSSTPLKVASVTARATDTQDLSAAASKVLRWNGMSLAQNAAAGHQEPAHRPGKSDSQALDLGWRRIHIPLGLRAAAPARTAESPANRLAAEPHRPFHPCPA